MKKGLIFCLLIFALSIAGCLFEEGEGDEAPDTGKLKVTVNTSEVIWTYPLLVSGTNYLVYQGATDNMFASVNSDQYVFRYPKVGGDGTVASLPAGYYDLDLTLTVASNYKNKFVGTDAEGNTVYKFGSRINYVYLFAVLDQKSDTPPVLYKGESSVNGSDGVITITNIKPGAYYVVAFYDYASGGELENILNRYDRYAIYTETGGLPTSTPYYDKATKITIVEGQTKNITLDINENWVLGKPKADNRTDPANENTATVKYEMGRYFLKDGEGIPTPDGL